MGGPDWKETRNWYTTVAENMNERGTFGGILQSKVKGKVVPVLY
jgi:hypothetical protein